MVHQFPLNCVKPKEDNISPDVYCPKPLSYAQHKVKDRR